MPTFDQLLSRPAASTVALAEITAAVPLEAWTAYTTIWRHKLPDDLYLVALAVDGVAVTQAANVAAVEATAGRWFQDDDYIYYHPAAGEPFDAVLVATAAFYFSDTEKLFENYYDPRLKSVPKLSLRIEREFGGVAQIGGGRISFDNTDGFFDAFAGVVRWNNGRAVIRMGIDAGRSEMAYEDYRIIGTWSLDGAGETDSTFDLQVKERKENLRVEIPIEKFSREDWPSIDDDLVGKPVPLVIGRCLGIKPYLVDPNLGTLKVSSHAIKGFIGLRKQEKRKRTETRTPDWYKVTGTNYYRTSFASDVLRIVCDGTTLEEKSGVDEVDATASTWHKRDNYIYIRPPASVTPTAANTTVEIEISYEVWLNCPFATRDTANGEFTVSETHWDGEQELSVDVIGLTDEAGDAMENPADMIAFLLSLVGETDLDTDSFDAARSYFYFGTNRYNQARIVRKISLWLEDEVEVLEIIERVNRQCGTFLYVNALGQWHLGVIKPEPVTDLLELSESEFLEVSRDEDTDKVYSSVEVAYAVRNQDGWNEVATVSSERLRLFNGFAVHSTLQVECDFWESKDARYMAQRILSTQGQPLVTYKGKLPRLGMVLAPGDKVRLVRDRGGKDEVLEVIEIDYDIGSKSVSLLLGNQRGWGRSCGFWTGAEIPAWDSGVTDAEARDAAGANGYWTDPAGFADSDDSRSFKVSRWW